MTVVTTSVFEQLFRFRRCRRIQFRQLADGQIGAVRRHRVRLEPIVQLPVQDLPDPRIDIYQRLMAEFANRKERDVGTVAPTD